MKNEHHVWVAAEVWHSVSSRAPLYDVECKWGHRVIAASSVITHVRIRTSRSFDLQWISCFIKYSLFVSLAEGWHGFLTHALSCILFGNLFASRLVAEWWWCHSYRYCGVGWQNFMNQCNSAVVEWHQYMQNICRSYVQKESVLLCSAPDSFCYVHGNYVFLHRRHLICQTDLLQMEQPPYSQRGSPTTFHSRCHHTPLWYVHTYTVKRSATELTHLPANVARHVE